MLTITLKLRNFACTALIAVSANYAVAMVSSSPLQLNHGRASVASVVNRPMPPAVAVVNRPMPPAVAVVNRPMPPSVAA
jgi:hypothetical protein